MKVQKRELCDIIIDLWDILDSVDTSSEQYIDGNRMEIDAKFSLICDKTQERFKKVQSDGYDLFINGEKIT